MIFKLDPIVESAFLHSKPYRNDSLQKMAIIHHDNSKKRPFWDLREPPGGPLYSFIGQRPRRGRWPMLLHTAIFSEFLSLRVSGSPSPPQRLMTRKKSSRDPSRMLRFWPFFGRFMSPGSESKKLGLISKIKIDFTFFQYAVCWHNPFIFFVSCFFTSKFTV